MDLSVIGRERLEEQAILEELSGSPTSVRAADRRWMVALAGIAASVCVGFVGAFVAPPSADTDLRSVDGPPRPTAWGSAAAQSPAPPIDLLLPAGGALVTGGQVAVDLTAAPGRKVHVSVTVGDAVLGWRDVVTNEDGAWKGEVPVFAPRVALPAVVHAAALLQRAPVEAHNPIVLDGNSALVVWDASVIVGSDGRPTAVYHATAPLAFTDIAAWVAGADGSRAGASAKASHGAAPLPGSAGGRELGLGSVTGTLLVRGPVSRPLVLHIVWHDPATGASGTVLRVLAEPDWLPPPP
jgi:hypothetical protein